jgi:uncharacterized protein
VGGEIRKWGSTGLACRRCLYENASELGGPDVKSESLSEHSDVLTHMKHRMSPQTWRLPCTVLLVLVCLPVDTVPAETPKFVTAADPISQACLRPMKGDFRRPDQVGLTASEVNFVNAGGHRLRAWFFPVKNARQSVLFCMGNTGNISLALPYAKILQQGEFDVLLFDYQGFGESQGVPSVAALLTDCLAAFDFLQQHTQRATEDIGVFGVSLGSFLALAVAAERQAGAVAVEDAFIPDETLDRFAARVTGDSAVAQMTLQAVKSLLLGRVDPLQNVTRLQCPVFFLHGERDRLLRPSGTLRIAANVTVPKRIWLIPNTGHAPESLETNDREYARQVTTFFHEAFAGTVKEPDVELTVTKQNSGPTGLSVQATISADGSRARRPMMLTLVDARGRRRFVPFWIQDQTTVDTRLRDRPVHAFAIPYYHVTATDIGWEPDLSAYSRSLATYHQDASRLLKGSLAADYLTRSNGFGFGRYGRMIPKFPMAAAADLLQQMSVVEQAPPRVRARYARLLARLHCWPQHRLGDAHGHTLNDFGEAMLSCLPADPDDYYELQNAGMQLTFRDTVVGDSLFRLAKLRLQDGQPEQAQQLLREHVSVLPDGVTSNLTEERIRSIRTLTDLVAP